MLNFRGATCMMTEIKKPRERFLDLVPLMLKLVT